MREPIMPSSYSYEDITIESPQPQPRPALMKSVPAEQRNEKCPCGSLRKAKNCRCTTEYMGLPSSVPARLRNILT